MNIPRIISQITFGSGYPLGPGGRWNNEIRACNMNNTLGGIKPYHYPGYPGMLPEPDTKNPFGGILEHPHLNYIV